MHSFSGIFRILNSSWKMSPTPKSPRLMLKPHSSASALALAYKIKMRYAGDANASYNYNPRLVSLSPLGAMRLWGAEFGLRAGYGIEGLRGFLESWAW
jgi:hypothetical protein